jgi:hypothetical protein
MLRTLLICGLLAGLAAGVVAAGVAAVVGEPAVDRAIAYEDAQAAAAGVAPGAETVSRDLQKSVGLLTATCVFGVALGGLFALAFAWAYGRVGRASPARTALLLALAAFVVVYLVPFAKYPATPPAVGDPDTIQRRTLLYLVMIAISVLAAVAAVRLRRTLGRSLAPAVATLLAIAAYGVVVVAAGLSLPAVDEVPASYPADVLWDFRTASIVVQAALWTTLGVLFAAAAQYVMTGERLWSRLGRGSLLSAAGRRRRS